METDSYELIITMYSFMMILIMGVLPMVIIIFVLSRLMRFVRRSFKIATK